MAEAKDVCWAASLVAVKAVPLDLKLVVCLADLMAASWDDWTGHYKAGTLADFGVDRKAPSSADLTVASMGIASVVPMAVGWVFDWAEHLVSNKVDN